MNIRKKREITYSVLSAPVKKVLLNSEAKKNRTDNCMKLFIKLLTISQSQISWNHMEGFKVIVIVAIKNLVSLKIGASQH